MARRAIKKGETDSLRAYLSHKLTDSAAIDRIVAVSQLAVAVGALWKS